MLTMDVLNDDCLMRVFDLLDIDDLTNVIETNPNRYLDAGRSVFKRKFQNNVTILGGSDTIPTNYINRLNHFGDLFLKLRIHFPLPQINQILHAIGDNCKGTQTELEIYFSDDCIDQNVLEALRLFMQNLTTFSHLRELTFKYGEQESLPGNFDDLDIIIPQISSLKKLIIYGFGGSLNRNLKKSFGSNPQIEELNLIIGFEDLHSSYLTFIAEKLTQLKSLDLRFAYFFDMDGSSTPLNFKCLETLKVVCYFGNVLPFSGTLMNKLENLDYICVMTSDQMIKIVSQFHQVKKLKIGAHKLTDNHLMILAKNLEKIEFLDIFDPPADGGTKFLFTAEAIKEFLNKRDELNCLFISMQENSIDANEELISNIKHVLNDTEWVVLEQNFPGKRYIVIFSN